MNDTTINNVTNISITNILQDAYVHPSDMEDAEPEIVKALLHYIIKVLTFVEDNLGDNKLDKATLDLASALKDKLSLNLSVNDGVVAETFNVADSIERSLIDGKKNAD